MILVDGRTTRCLTLGPGLAALLAVAEASLVALGHTASRVKGLADVPAFDPSWVDDPPSEVSDFQNQIRLVMLC